MRSLPILCCLLVSLSLAAYSQNNIILFGEGLPALPYTTRTSKSGARLNYYNFFARLPNKSVTELQIAYSEGIGGIFQEDNISIIDRATGNIIPIKEVKIDREGRGVRIIFNEEIPGTRKQVEIRVAGVTNPRNAGVYELVIQVLGTEANPLFQTLGRWLVNIS